MYKNMKNTLVRKLLFYLMACSAVTIFKPSAFDRSYNFNLNSTRVTNTSNKYCIKNLAY